MKRERLDDKCHAFIFFSERSTFFILTPETLPVENLSTSQEGTDVVTSLFFIQLIMFQNRRASSPVTGVTESLFLGADVAGECFFLHFVHRKLVISRLLLPLFTIALANIRQNRRYSI